MSKSALFAALFGLLPLAAIAGSLTTPVEPVVVAPVVPAPSPELIFTLRGGATYTPTYFGSSNYEFGPDIGFNLHFLNLPGNRDIGTTDPYFIRTGIAPRLSFRVVKKRDDADHAELAGLNDIDLSVELGGGLGFYSRNFEAFADVRYGVVGHEFRVGELGADVVLRPSDRLKITAGPRLFLGDDSYAGTYFGVTAAESAASGGSFAAFGASGGPLSAGVEIGVTYALNDQWGIDGAIRYDRLLNDAADSPITAQGSEDQFSVRIGLTRRFTLDF